MTLSELPGPTCHLAHLGQVNPRTGNTLWRRRHRKLVRETKRLLLVPRNGPRRLGIQGIMEKEWIGGAKKEEELCERNAMLTECLKGKEGVSGNGKKGLTENGKVKSMELPGMDTREGEQEAS